MITKFNCTQTICCYMKERLSDEIDRLKLYHSPAEPYSAISGENIERGDLCLMIETHDPDKRNVWFKTESTQTVYNKLNNLTPDDFDKEDRTYLSRSISTNYGRQESPCMVCDHTSPSQTHMVQFRWGGPWVHRDCVPKFLDILEQGMEDYSEVFISENL